MIHVGKKGFGGIRSLLFVGSIAAGLAVGGARPALAGSGAFNKTGSLNAARFGHTATLLATGGVLVTGGENRTTGFLASAEIYSPATGKWTLAGSMSAPRYGHDAVLLHDGRVLVAGGINGIGGPSAPPLSSAELYDPSTGKWTATGSMSAGRYSFILVTLADGRALAAGGTGNTYLGLTSAELYDPATGTWTATGSTLAGLINTDAVLLPDGRVFAPSISELYDPASGTWTAAGPAPGSSSSGPPIALLPGGQVWVGSDELYDPSANQWIPFAPPCSCGPFGGALLPGGKVLDAGGTTYIPGTPYPTLITIKSAEVWDPSTLAWTSTGNLNTSTAQASATTLPNGQVLVAGGQSFDKSVGALVPIATSELYTP